ncbi:alginate O-acetyltransferase AlgX-related protein [Bizionia argentinensis]|nr:hypothetical protein [Bizionia argentinensis]
MMIIAPNVVMISNLETTKKDENKGFQNTFLHNITKPIAFLKQFKNNYAESFGLKTTLVNSYIDFKYQALRETPMPNKVVKGQNGWYFLGNSYNNILNNAFGYNYFSTSELKEIANNLNEVKNYLKEQNITFYLVIPPNKNSVYKEQLPFQLKEQMSNLDVLKDYLKNHINFEVIDLTKVLKAKKNKNQLFFKTDSHWNDFGAFIGYTETLRYINQDFIVPNVKLTDYKIEIKSVRQGDIIKMINLDIEESTVTLTKKIASEITFKNIDQNYFQMVNPDKKLKVFMHHDSFSYAWMPYFNESFGEIHYLKSYALSKKLIEQETPNIVIFEIIERNIDILLNNKFLIK